MKKSIGAKTIVYPTPVFVVGTYDKEGKPNVMTAAWGGICCSNPPCVTISLRKATYSYDSIMLKRAYTISIPTVEFVKEADYFGMASGKNENKFDKTGLTPVRSDVVDAPYVKEFPFVLECKVIHILEIGLHTQFVGEILDVKVNEEVLDNRGEPDISMFRPFIFSPDTKSYYAIGDLIGKGFSIGRTFLGKAGGE